MFGGAKKWSERKVKSKKCKECGIEFTPFCGGNLYCDTCSPIVKKRKHAKNQKEWRAKNPQRHSNLKSEWDLKKYGINLNEYNLLLQKQNGKCAICKTSNPKGRGKNRKFAVDHCHITNKVRGLLCPMCNTAIGLLQDNIEIIENAKQYIIRSNKQS